MYLDYGLKAMTCWNFFHIVKLYISEHFKYKHEKKETILIIYANIILF